MRKGIILLTLLIFIATPCWAGLNENEQQQKQLQQMQQQMAQLQAQLQLQLQLQASIAAQQQSMQNSGNQAVNVEGDENNARMFGAGSLTTAEGTSGLNAGTPWGNLAVGTTDRYVKLNTRAGVVKTFSDDGLITEDLSKDEALDIVIAMRKETKPVRFAGCLWETDGANFFNMFGLLSHRSFKNE